jgi:hypothetical protein
VRSAAVAILLGLFYLWVVIMLIIAALHRDWSQASFWTLVAILDHQVDLTARYDRLDRERKVDD